MKQPKRQLGVLDLAHQFLRAQIRPGDLCIDATCGRGHDTKLLCELTGRTKDIMLAGGLLDYTREALKK